MGNMSSPEDSAKMFEAVQPVKLKIDQDEKKCPIEKWLNNFYDMKLIDERQKEEIQPSYRKIEEPVQNG
jgi:hypothetical protein